MAPQADRGAEQQGAAWVEVNVAYVMATTSLDSVCMYVYIPIPRLK